MKIEYAYAKTIMSDEKVSRHSGLLVDSVMRKVINSATNYQNTLASADAEIYIKGRSEILKKNSLIQFAHHLFPVKSNIKDYVFELVSHATFNYPNTFSYKIQAINGSYIPNNKKQQEMLNFLNINIYSPTAYNDELLMPLAKNAFHYYDYKLEEVDESLGYKIYKIRFTPKQASNNLVRGRLYVVDKLWIIDKIEMIGNLNFAEFDISMTYGKGYKRFNLPQVVDLNLRYAVLGNVVVSTYHSCFDYKSLVWVKDINAKKTYDLTNYYQLMSDTVSVISDPNYWLIKRDIPLSEEEQNLYTAVQVEKNQEQDTTEVTKYLDFTERITSTMNLNYKSTRIKYSGLLNPFQLGYSKMNGITYRQQLRLSKTLKNDKQLRFRPEVGYLFKRKDVLFKFGGEWEYAPQRFGILSLNLGNGNQGYSSEMMKDINEQLKDSTFNFDDLNLEYFKHYYLEIKNNIELVNGLQITPGIRYNHRKPVNKTTKSVDGEVTEIINKNYNDFTPSLGVTYTPGQYYKMDGRHKEYMYSNYPTISVEYSGAIPKVLGSNGSYGRLEVDVQQSISLGLLRKFNYHASAGMYVNKKDTYFADFRYFTRSNYPDTWTTDEFGGIFNLLNGGWFNASDKYVQLHTMYQSPFMLFKLYKRAGSKYVVQERFYLSQLWMPILPSYTEIGYGIGNHIFNVAAFASFEKHKYQTIGLRFAFELFQ